MECFGTGTQNVLTTGLSTLKRHITEVQEAGAISMHSLRSGAFLGIKVVIGNVQMSPGLLTSIFRE